METDPGMRDPPKICQPPERCSYPPTTATWRMKLNPTERVDFFLTLCNVWVKERGSYQGKKNLLFFPELSKAISSF